MKIYLASPFFNDIELKFVSRAEETLRKRGFDVFSPREHEDREHEVGTHPWAEAIFKMDRDHIHDCDVMVMLYHGNYSDSGTAWECGYAYGIGKPVIAIQLGENSNLMVHESVTANISIEDLETYDFETLPSNIYEGAMF